MVTFFPKFRVPYFPLSLTPHAVFLMEMNLFTKILSVVRKWPSEGAFPFVWFFCQEVFLRVRHFFFFSSFVLSPAEGVASFFLPL